MPIGQMTGRDDGDDSCLTVDRAWRARHEIADATSAVTGEDLIIQIPFQTTCGDGCIACAERRETDRRVDFMISHEGSTSMDDVDTIRRDPCANAVEGRQTVVAESCHDTENVIDSVASTPNNGEMTEPRSRGVFERQFRVREIFV